MKTLILLLLALPLGSRGEEPVSASPAAPTVKTEAANAVQASHYELRNLKVVGYSMQLNVGSQRHFFQFQNEQGSHYFVVEESPNINSSFELGVIRPLVTQDRMMCKMDIDCKQKAFCTNDCKSLYYEIVSISENAKKSNCTINAVSCVTEAYRDQQLKLVNNPTPVAPGNAASVAKPSTGPAPASIPASPVAATPQTAPKSEPSK